MAHPRRTGSGRRVPGRLPLPAFEWTARAARPDLVELETFGAGHTLCWNTDPDRWQRIATTWLKARVPH